MPTDDVGFAHVRAAKTFAILLTLTACSTANEPADNMTAATTDATAILDNVATADGALPWSYVSPDLRFAPNSPARSLPRPAVLGGARFGYFGDPGIRRQYSPAQLAQMKADRAGFVARRDLDGDGIAETYRTGFWQIGDTATGEAREGSFLAVFDPGHAPQVIDSTSADDDAGVFFSQQGGTLVVAWCNCPQAGTVGYRYKRLTVSWSPPRPRTRS